MVEQNLKDKTVKGVIWSSVERFSVQGVQFLVMLVIARILDPKDFGLVGMLAIFIAVAQILIDSGFYQALIRKQDRTEKDNCTVFYFNIVTSLLIYLILYSVAPYVAMFYGEPDLISLMRVLCVIVIINSLTVVQRAIYTASLNFKIQAKASLIAAFISGAVGIYMAYNDYGVWALVWQQLINAGVNALVLWLHSSWYPKWLYSWNSFYPLFFYGSKLLASGLLETVYSNMYTLVIGKVFSASSLGFYTQADRFTRIPSSSISTVLSKVIFPVLSNVQNEDARLRNIYRKLLRVSVFVVFPVMCCLAGISYPLVALTIGEKWRFAASLIIPLCFSGMWYPVQALNLDLLQVKGRSDLFLKLEVIKKAFGILFLTISVQYGIVFMCYGSIVMSIFSLIINTYYTGKLINVGFFLQMKDIIGTLLASMVMFVFVFLITKTLRDNILQLSVGILVGAATYFSIVYIFRFKELSYLKSLR